MIYYLALINSNIIMRKPPHLEAFGKFMWLHEIST